MTRGNARIKPVFCDGIVADGTLSCFPKSVDLMLGYASFAAERGEVGRR